MWETLLEVDDSLIPLGQVRFHLHINVVSTVQQTLSLIPEVSGVSFINQRRPNGKKFMFAVDLISTKYNATPFQEHLLSHIFIKCRPAPLHGC